MSEVVKVSVEPIETVEEPASYESKDKREIVVRSPKSYEVLEVEVTGDLVILRGFTSVFGKVVDQSRVYKRVR